MDFLNRNIAETACNHWDPTFELEKQQTNMYKTSQKYDKNLQNETDF